MPLDQERDVARLGQPLATEHALVLPAASRHHENMFPTTTFFGRDLRDFTVGGYAFEGTPVAFACMAGRLAGFNYHFTQFNGWLLAELAGATGRQTTNAHRNQAKILTSLLAAFLGFDFTGIPLTVKTNDGRYRFVVGRSGLLPWADPRFTPRGWVSYSGGPTAGNVE